MMLMKIAYNFMSLFRQFIVNEKVWNRLSTIRYKLLFISSYIKQTYTENGSSNAKKGMDKKIMGKINKLILYYFCANIQLNT